MVSPRNHFLFTPLLASTTTGTLEFRCITEPIRHLDRIAYHQSRCMDIDAAQNEIVLRDSFETSNIYRMPYDYLVYSVGSQANDFGISGVRQNALFLKQVRDAMQIRNKIQELFERASKPTSSRDDRDRLLSVVVVGGGPTSIEYTAELYDWLMEDGAKMFPELIDHVTITLLEASDNILSMFGADLAEYTINRFRKRKIRVLTNSRVVRVEKEFVELQDGYQIPYGAVVWATGLMPNTLTNNLGEWQKSKTGRICVTDHLTLHSPSYDNIFCIGDCAETISGALPPTGQVANQQGKYIARKFNHVTAKPWSEFEQHFTEQNKVSFNFVNRGTMAYIGGWKGVTSLPHHLDQDTKTNAFKRRFTRLQGLRAWLFWRSAYFTMLTSTANRILVPMYWFKAWIFGRDFSRF
uniref:FAD/NAD(P)-binding domain-containing protein n=1 Tax=Elphidium margaritaceum TaxID=933848 RepID=A0A7S0XN65_9EUKA|mmetsp:Transcript_2100/g.4066  ORF Transcript_2100/g.4066 Transcript_2100/m.4066 type:complete len:409 (+) Transcript_2100:231-1457(+)